MSLSQPQIQTAATKFVTEEFRPPAENDASSSSFDLEVECNIDDQQIMAQQDLAFRDSVPLGGLENGGSLNVEDIPLLDMSMEDFGILFQLTEDRGPWVP